MSFGKEAVVEAIRESPNLAEAAKRLQISRKTLFNRMRAYGIPRGRSGRPKKKITYRRKSRVLAVGAGVVAGALAVGLIVRGGKSA